MIVAAVRVEKIYLLASTLEQKRTESVFITTAPSVRKVGHYYLLALIDRQKGNNENYVQDTIENTCRSLVSVTAIVLHTPKFNKWLEEGNRFAIDVINTAVVHYERVKTPLVIPAAPSKASAGFIDNYFKEAINKANQFIEDADFFRSKQQNKMAAFMLHQATKQSLHGMFKKATGLHLNTHNIDKLIRYCSMVSHKISDVFSGDRDQKLFQLLQHAYIDTRYKQDFTITDTKLIIWRKG